MITVDKREIKRIRILKVFINAAFQIIEEEGIGGVTIRKVGQIAGYNSATIYNYFKNRQQLISFAAVKYISDYVQAVSAYMDQSTNTLERFFLMWECFCLYSFKNPQIYYAIFTEDIGEKPGNLFKVYYTIFSEELGEPSEELKSILLETDLAKRANRAIQPCVEEGYFTVEEAEEINQMIMLMYHGMLSLIINNRIDSSVEESVQKIMSYIRMTANIDLKERLTREL